METQNINVASALVFGNGDGGRMPLSLVEMGIIRNLKQSQTILLRSGLSGTWAGKGTMRYDVTGFSKTGAYNHSSVTKQIPYSRQIYVHLEERRIIAFEVETLDQVNLSGTLSPIVNTFIANQTASVEADLKYHFYKGQLDFFKANPEQTMFIPELIEERVLSSDQARFLQKQLVLVPVKMSKKYTEKYLGIPTQEFVGVIDGLGAVNIDSILTGMNQSTKAFDTIVNGYTGKDNGKMFQLGGLNLIVDNMLNTDIAQGASFNGDYAVEFADEGFIGAIHHQDTILYPTTPYIFRRRVNETFNDEGSIKYESGFGMAYPDLYTALLNKLVVYGDRDATTGAQIATVKVGETINLHTNASSLRTVTWTSGDATKATVNAGVVTGVAVADEVTITATITDANLSGSPFTATYKVKVVA